MSHKAPSLFDGSIVRPAIGEAFKTLHFVKALWLSRKKGPFDIVLGDGDLDEQGPIHVRGQPFEDVVVQRHRRR